MSCYRSWVTFESLDADCLRAWRFEAKSVTLDFGDFQLHLGQRPFTTLSDWAIPLDPPLPLMSQASAAGDDP